MRRIRFVDISIFVLKYIFNWRFWIAELTKKSKAANKIIDKTLFEDVQLPQGNTCEEILPELWHEPIEDFDQAVYNRQLATFNATMAQIKVIYEDNVRESKE